ncbi:MAG TPA: serine/threonine-protein kinase [Gaiellaceae bacterium]|nr:serine/threonine-protein kinase [Gaiellaceae bacterium]
MASTTEVLPGRYANGTLIAHGGMGQVFHATDKELGRDVAVKVLADRYADNEAVRARFRREALTAARLSGNPNIVTIYDVLEYERRPMIVMEYLRGGSLESRIKGHGGCPPAQVFAWLEQAASALDAAHAAGVVHRDIKPGNLLLDELDQVHVGDFGIASAIGLDSFTETGTILGTAGYLSPEQARGERASAASDRYGLAVVAYELLAGRRPFESDSTTAEAARHATAPVPPIQELKRDLPPAFDRVFQRALAKDPAARYPSSTEFVSELRAALHEDAGTTGWILPARPIPTAITEVTRPAPSAPPRPAVPQRRPTSRRWLLPLLLLLLLGGGLAAAAVATRGGGSPSAAGKRKPKAVTILRTVTRPGTTIEQTVTAPAAPPPTEATTSTPPVTAPAVASTGASLNLQGYAKMRAGDYQGALPLLQQAVQKLQGTGSLDEAYADYNLAYTRYELGQCTGVLPLLDRSQAIQGARTEIDALRRDARKACG